MPATELADRHQKAVLWMANGFDDYGEVIVSAAVEVRVRWEEKKQESVDSKGNTIALDAFVVVDRAIVVGSIMWLGAKDDLAAPPVSLKQVVEYRQIPDIKGRIIRRVVLLVRFSNEIPTIA